MRSEERLDPASAGHTEAVDAYPPVPTARHSKREIGQRPDAGRPQRLGDPRFEPAINAITDQRDWNGSNAQLIERGGHGARSGWPATRRPGEELGEIISVAGPGQVRDTPTDRPDGAA